MVVRQRPQGDRRYRLSAALRILEERFGPEAVRRLGTPRAQPPDRAIPSGSLGLDLATGLNGLPRGGITELVGGETSGKTALLHSALAAVQRAGGLVALIDAEGSVDAESLAACGVVLDDLLLAHPASASDAMLLLTILARCKGLDLLGLSSVPALRDLPAGNVRAAAEHSLAAHDVGRLMARGLRVLAASLGDSPTAIVVTNEPALLPIGHEDGTLGRSLGGRALGHYALLRVLVEPQCRLLDAGGGTVGHRVALTIAKSKVGRVGGRVEVDVLAASGVDAAGELLRLGLVAGVVVRHPLGFLYGDDLLGHSEGKALRRLRDDPALADALRLAILAARRQAA
jgi:recombination protein RecA